MNRTYLSYRRLNHRNPGVAWQAAENCAAGLCAIAQVVIVAQIIVWREYATDCWMAGITSALNIVITGYRTEHATGGLIAAVCRA